MILRSPQPLAPYERHLGEMLRRWAAEAPGRTFLAERREDDWRRLSYGEALRLARAVAQSLLDRGVSADRPVMILSGNSIDHAVVTLGGLLAGVPVAPVSPAYSLMSRDYGKLGQVFDTLRPAVVFVERPELFLGALRSLDLSGVEVVTSDTVLQGLGATPLARWLGTEPGRELAAAEAAVDGDTVAKILFTSGSTGSPKGVINTHRMLCANQQMIEQCWPFLRSVPPVLVDWLPWNHTFGANHNFNMVMKHGGTLYIDSGKPAPGLIEQTVRNLREISPTLYFNVPAGFTQLVTHLERDAGLREGFFRRLQLIFYAGAALPQDLWDRLDALATTEIGHPVLKASAWGATETAPLATSVHFAAEHAGVIGLPAPGVELKLLPVGSKLEMRVKGPNVTPGYFRDEELTRGAFDEEGYYRIGDAGRLADPRDPSRGLVFDGRVAESFKLTSGTWVHAGALRVKLLAAAAPVLHDAVIGGQGRPYLALLAWPNLIACQDLCRDPEIGDDPVKLIRCAAVIDHLRQAFRRYNAEHPGSSTRIERVALMVEPPSIDAGEITDKGYVNQLATLERRARLVDRLYQADPPDGVIVIGE